MQMLKDIARENEGVEDDALVSFAEFADSSLNLTFIYYIKRGEDIFETQTKINMAILTRFNENQLEFAYPTQVLYNKAL